MSKNWFETLFGFTENKNVINIMEKEIISNNRIILSSKANGEKFKVGHFSILSLYDLREKTKCYKKNTFQKVTVRNLITQDILLEHYQNPNSLFQVASQFNILEMKSPKTIPEQGITDYQSDYTQGPACSLACGAATMYRNYFIPVKDKKNNMIQYGQSDDCQINNLDDVQELLKEDYFWMKNGYLFSSAENLTNLNKVINQYEQDIMGKLKFGLHLGTEVCFIDRFTKSPDVRFVSQIFCSAVSCSYSYIDNKLWKPFAFLILKASYEATLLAAIYNRNNGGSKKVFLTLLGGGAFGNELIWIMDAIEYAIDSISVYNSDLEIIICEQSKLTNSS